MSPPRVGRFVTPPSDRHRHDAGTAADRDDADDADGPPGCPRCGHGEARTARTSTGGEPSALNLTTIEQFVTVTCERCGYTDLYDVDGGGSPVDLFLGYGYEPAGDRSRATMKSSGGTYHCGSCGVGFTDGDVDECPNCGREFV